MSNRLIPTADLSVREEQGIPAVRILELETDSGLIEIATEASDLWHIAAVLAGNSLAGALLQPEPAGSRSGHDPVLAQKYPRFESVTRLIEAGRTTFVFSTNQGHHALQFDEKLLPTFVDYLELIADEWMGS